MKAGYFDNAATTFVKPPQLYEYVAQYMQENGANAGRGEYDSTITAGKLIHETRELLLTLLGAGYDREVVFMPSATIALNTVLNGIQISRESTVYVTHFEHNAVMRVLYALQKRINFKIEFLPCDPETFEFDPHEIQAQFARHKPEVVIMSQVSNVCGVIVPVREIAQSAKKFGATVIVDAAQACGLLGVDLSLVDYYIFAGHKTLFAPPGIGGFICKKNSDLRPFIYGGTGIDSANREMPSSIPERFEAGSQNLMAIAGLNYALKWRKQVGQERILSVEQANTKRLLEILSTYSFIKLVGEPAHRISIVSCNFSGFTSDETGRILNERGISVRTGLHCAPEAHKFLQTFPAGTVRFSISYFTSDADFDKLTSTLSDLREEM